MQGDTRAPARQKIIIGCYVTDAKITSVLREEELSPATTLILPPATMDARAELNPLGREARGVQAVAPGRRVTTEERPLGPSLPPATTKA